MESIIYRVLLELDFQLQFFSGLNVNGITRSTQFDWGLGSSLNADQGGSIALGYNNTLGETPYMISTMD